MRKILLSVSSLLFTVAVAAQTEINKDYLGIGLSYREALEWIW